MATQAYSAFAETRMSTRGLGSGTGGDGESCQGSTMCKPDVRRRSDTAAALHLDHMQPAFLLDGSSPAAGALILAIGNRPGARPAADTGIVLIVQRVVGNAMLHHEAPDILLRPG